MRTEAPAGASGRRCACFLGSAGGPCMGAEGRAGLPTRSAISGLAPMFTPTSRECRRCGGWQTPVTVSTTATRADGHPCFTHGETEARS